MTDNGDYPIIGATIVDVEYHKDTGELLTLYLRTTDGKFVRMVPDNYKLASNEAPYEKFHTGCEGVFPKRNICSSCGAGLPRRHIW